MMESILNTIIEESSANDGEHTEHYKLVKSVNYHLNKFLSASAWSSL